MLVRACVRVCVRNTLEACRAAQAVRHMPRAERRTFCAECGLPRACVQEARWGRMATKLRLFELTEYDSVLYMDADTLLLREPTYLFRNLPSPFAAEAGGPAAHRRPASQAPPFNAGVLRITPSNATLASLMVRSLSAPPTIFGNVVDCTEQALLNSYFDGSTPERTATRFSIRRPMTLPAANRNGGVDAGAGTGVDALVAHWITTRCPKPWDYMPREYRPAAPQAAHVPREGGEGGEGSEPADKLETPYRLPADCDPSLYSYWWRVYSRTASDALSGYEGRYEGGRGGKRRRLGNEYEGCSIGCPDSWVDDGVCDEACNNESCGYDGKDCFKDAGECWTAADGSDYRGKVAVTSGGRMCQAWSAQSPNHHTMTTIYYPHAGLGGHNYCRNPEGSAGGPWCYTMDFPNVRRESCNVGPRAASCDPNHPSHAMPGGQAAPEALQTSQTATSLALGVMADGTASELETIAFVCPIPPWLPGIKVRPPFRLPCPVLRLRSPRGGLNPTPIFGRWSSSQSSATRISSSPSIHLPPRAPRPRG